MEFYETGVALYERHVFSLWGSMKLVSTLNFTPYFVATFFS